MAAGEGRADVLLAAGVVALLFARVAWAGGDGNLEPSFLLALGAAVVLCGAAAASRSALAAGVRALLAAIAFFAFAVDPTTGWDERNFAYGTWGTVFAAVAVARVGRRRQIERAREDAPAAQRAVAGATWVAGALLLAGAATFVGVILFLFWALSSGSGST